MSKKAIVIGSGFAGLSSACFLAKQGFKVTLLEKNDSPGGRARQFTSDGFVFDKIAELKPDLIVLAGFLWKMPEEIVKAYPNKIINIHPALLPKYGGKGMYGIKVHQMVLENKENETGITIHYVNEHYDEGDFIFQQKVAIEDCKTPEDVANKIHELEHKHFPIIIKKILNHNS